jgi:hypothetical protein
MPFTSTPASWHMAASRANMRCGCGSRLHRCFILHVDRRTVVSHRAALGNAHRCRRTGAPISTAESQEETHPGLSSNPVAPIMLQWHSVHVAVVLISGWRFDIFETPERKRQTSQWSASNRRPNPLIPPKVSSVHAAESAVSHCWQSVRENSNTFDANSAFSTCERCNASGKPQMTFDERIVIEK